MADAVWLHPIWFFWMDSNDWTVTEGSLQPAKHPHSVVLYSQEPSHYFWAMQTTPDTDQLIFVCLFDADVRILGFENYCRSTSICDGLAGSAADPLAEHENRKRLVFAFGLEALHSRHRRKPTNIVIRASFRRPIFVNRWIHGCHRQALGPHREYSVHLLRLHVMFPVLWPPEPIVRWTAIVDQMYVCDRPYPDRHRNDRDAVMCRTSCRHSFVDWTVIEHVFDALDRKPDDRLLDRDRMKNVDHGLGHRHHPRQSKLAWNIKILQITHLHFLRRGEFLTLNFMMYTSLRMRRKYPTSLVTPFHMRLCVAFMLSASWCSNRVKCLLRRPLQVNMWLVSKWFTCWMCARHWWKKCLLRQ